MCRWMPCAILVLLILRPAAPVSAAPINLNGYRFEPGVSEPVVPDDLRAAEPGPDQSATALLQFVGPVEEGWKEQVDRAGVKLISYIPENAFIVLMDGAARDRVSRLPFVRWTGPFHVAYRISPDIGRTLFRSPERQQDPLLMLRVRVTSVRDLASATAAASRFGTVLETIDDPGHPGFVIHLPRGSITALASIGNVVWVEEKPETFILNNVTKWVVQSNVLDMTSVWDRGIRGAGQIVCEMDTGLDYNSCWFRDTENAPPGPNHRKVVDYRTFGGHAYDGCANGHGTHVAGTVVGDQSFINPGVIDYNGMAWQAKIMIQDVGTDADVPCRLGLLSVPSTLATAFSDAWTKGARVHTDSWGTGFNLYDGYAVDVDTFMWNHKDFLCCFADGNLGPGGSTVGSPATAKDCVSVGATRQAPEQETIASYSGRGPASDGRLKPTVAAPGAENPVYINSADNDRGNPPAPTCLTQGNPFAGTSMATPAVAGCALLIRDYFVHGFYPQGESGGDPIQPSAALVKATLVNSGKDIGSADQPNSNEGWGRVLLEDALYFRGDSRELRVVDDSVGIATGEEIEYAWNVDASTEPFEITLVWTDYPGTQGANPALVNDLDLTVTAPDGSVYLGNVYSGGQSSTGGAADRRNVEECVLRTAPATGDWRIRVRGQNVPMGGRQPFAMVATGSFGGWPEPPADAGVVRGMDGIRLEPARPNPAASTATFTFEMPATARVRLTVHDASGRTVAVLAEGVFGAGRHTTVWDASGFPSGIYACRMETDRAVTVRRIALIH